MPRKGRGSKQGTPPPKKAPIRAQTDQSYGDRAATIASQQAIQPSNPNAAIQSDAASMASSMSRRDQVMAAAQQMQVGATPLTAPTQRPGEPPTAGLPTGPGHGPSPLPPAPRPQVSTDSLLFAPYLPVFEILANGPRSTASFRQMVRRLRSQVPAGHLAEMVAQQNPAQGGMGGMAGGGMSGPGPSAMSMGAGEAGPSAPTPAPRPSGPASSTPAPSPSPQPGSPGY